MRPPADRRQRHDADLEQLDPARQPALLDLVGDLAGGRREHDVRQDEQAGDQVVEDGRRQRGPGQRVIGQHDQQRGLEQVVVEGAQELGPEEGTEATLAQQGELAGMAGVAHAVGARCCERCVIYRTTPDLNT